MVEFNTDGLRRVEEGMEKLEQRLIEEVLARAHAESKIRLESYQALAQERMAREVERARVEGIREGREQVWRFVKRAANTAGWLAALVSAVWAIATWVTSGA